MRLSKLVMIFHLVLLSLFSFAGKNREEMRKQELFSKADVHIRHWLGGDDYYENLVDMAAKARVECGGGDALACRNAEVLQQEASDFANLADHHREISEIYLNDI